MKQEYQLHQLSNGIRIAHKELPYAQVSHMGFFLEIGSRDEQKHQLGLAHFWEHMAFKGTKKRKAFHIINRLEALGGELNAYTTKEKICFYASILSKHYEKALELLSDITFGATFPEKQIDRERNVILEEMTLYEDSPEDALQDEFDSLIFAQHPLGHNILGTRESLRGFQRQDFYDFIQNNMQTSQIVWASVGNLPFEKVLSLAEKYLAPLPSLQEKRKRQPFKGYKAQQQEKTCAVQQSYCAIGTTSFAITHPKRLPFAILCNILGGPNMNSRLNMSLRERQGLVYSIEANYTPYSDTGFFGIFFGTAEKFLKKSIDLVHKELTLLQEKALGQRQLQYAKEQIIGQLAIQEESNVNLMLTLGNSLLSNGKMDALEEVFEAVRQVDATTLQTIAQEVFSLDNLSTLIFLPEHH